MAMADILRLDELLRDDEVSRTWMVWSGAADDDAIDNQALIPSTRCTNQLLVRYGYDVRWLNHRCGTWNASRELAVSSSGSQERSVGSAVNRVVTWRPSRMLIGRATKPLDGWSYLESS